MVVSEITNEFLDFKQTPQGAKSFQWRLGLAVVDTSEFRIYTTLLPEWEEEYFKVSLPSFSRCNLAEI